MNCPNSKQFHFSRGCSFFAKGECTSTCALRFHRHIYRLLRIIALTRLFMRSADELADYEANNDLSMNYDKWLSLKRKKTTARNRLITEMRDNHIAF